MLTNNWAWPILATTKTLFGHTAQVSALASCLLAMTMPRLGTNAQK